MTLRCFGAPSRRRRTGPLTSMFRDFSLRNSTRPYGKRGPSLTGRMQRTITDVWAKTDSTPFLCGSGKFDSVRCCAPVLLLPPNPHAPLDTVYMPQFDSAFYTPDSDFTHDSDRRGPAQSLPSHSYWPRLMSSPLSAGFGMVVWHGAAHSAARAPLSTPHRFSPLVS